MRNVFLANHYVGASGAGDGCHPRRLQGTRRMNRRRLAFEAVSAYLCRMRRPAFEPCIPTASKKVPDRPDWIHEIKQDGYRLLVHRDRNQVKLATRNGHDWTRRYPWIVEAARRIRTEQFVLDGEACILGVDGVANFDDLHGQQHNDEVQLYAFDLLAIDGDDLRELPLHLRKNQLSRLLARLVGGVQLAPFEQGEIGPDLFRAACGMGLEGIVSKRRDRPYRAGRSPDWIKVKNPAHPAMTRVMEAHSERIKPTTTPATAPEMRNRFKAIQDGND